MTLIFTHLIVFIAGAIAALVVISKSLNDGDIDALANTPRPRAAPPEARFSFPVSGRE